MSRIVKQNGVIYLCGQIGDPERFSWTSIVDEFLGLTPKRHQSGEVDCSGHVSKCGDHRVERCAVIA